MVHKKPKGWVKEPVRHGLAARGIITAQPIPPNLRGPNGIRREPKEDLEAYFRLIQKFRPHWKFEVLKDNPGERPPPGLVPRPYGEPLVRDPEQDAADDREDEILELEKKESEADAQFLTDVDRAIEYFYKLGFDYIAQQIELGNFENAAEFLAEEEASDTGPENRVDYRKAMEVLDSIGAPTTL